MKNYLIIGNGVAGVTAADFIRKNDQEGRITVVSEEDLPFYWRIRLNEYVAGELDEEALLAKKSSWYDDRRIEVKLNTRISGALPDKKAVLTEDNQELPFDSLLIATGSHSFIPSIKGSDRKGVFALRNIQDARDISAWSRDVNDVLLIGGGLLGLEAGNALRRLGKNIMVVEFFPRLLPRQLDVDGAKRLQGMMEKMGFSFKLGAKTQEIVKFCKPPHHSRALAR